MTGHYAHTLTHSFTPMSNLHFLKYIFFLEIGRKLDNMFFQTYKTTKEQEATQQETDTY